MTFVAGDCRRSGGKFCIVANEYSQAAANIKKHYSASPYISACSKTAAGEGSAMRWRSKFRQSQKLLAEITHLLPVVWSHATLIHTHAQNHLLNGCATQSSLYITKHYLYLKNVYACLYAQK